jgi:hypothetical protein
MRLEAAVADGRTQHARTANRILVNKMEISYTGFIPLLLDI